MIAATTRILLVGCGKMGGAILQRLSGGANAPTCYVVDPAQATAALPASVHWEEDAKQIPATFAPDLIVLAIKPQQMADVLPAYAQYKNAVFLSIAAGVTIERIGALLGGNYSIVRSMPNLPASIGHGVTAAVANGKVSASQRSLCQSLLEKIGKALWLDDEKCARCRNRAFRQRPPLISSRYVKRWQKRARHSVFLPIIAEQLARETIIGSGALLTQSAQSAAQLRQAVTSPGGTTEAALQKLMAADALPK